MAFTTITGDPLNVLTPGMQLIATATASTSASIDFDSGIDWTLFDMYEIHILNWLPTTDQTAVYFRVSDDGGATYKSGASDYVYNRAGVTSTSNMRNSSGGTSALQIASGGANQMTDSVESFSSVIRCYDLANSGTKAQFYWNNGYQDNDGTTNLVYGWGRYNTTATINGLRIVPHTSTIASGTFKLYGVA